MPMKTVYIDDSVELILDEPDGTTEHHRAIAVATALSDQFQMQESLTPSEFTGSVIFQIGYRAHKVYYTLRVKRVLDALTAYSIAIEHIERHPELYDLRLARHAVTVLRSAFIRRYK